MDSSSSGSLHFLWLVFLASPLIVAHVSSSIQAYDLSPSLFVFGASMVDSGTNSFVVPFQSYADFDPYGSDFFGKPVGRWSNGRTFMDTISQSLGFGLLDPFIKSLGPNFTHGVNFAAGGSTAQNITGIFLLVQVDQFQMYQSFVLSQQQGSKTKLRLKQQFSDSIYFIETAHNDYLWAGIDCDQLELVELVIYYMRRAFERLYELGARTFIVMNVTPLGCAPLILSSTNSTSTKDEYNCTSAWNDLVDLHNQHLNELLENLRSKYASAEWILFDAYSIFLDGYHNPSNYGLKYPFQACCGARGPYNYIKELPCGKSAKYINGTDIEITKCQDPSLHLIWDSIHPTKSFCEYIAQGVLYGTHFIPTFNITQRIQHVKFSKGCGLVEPNVA